MNSVSGGDLASNYSEVNSVQNPALGAYLLWRMGAAFQQGSSASPRMELHFLVLPILFHRATLEVLTKTLVPSGLSQFVSKLRDREDYVLDIHERALKLRQLSLDSLTIGAASGLFSIEYETALVRSLDVVRPAELPDRLRPMKKAAEKLGIWFSNNSLAQTLSMLRVVP
jgi:hypothetical protein